MREGPLVMGKIYGVGLTYLHPTGGRNVRFFKSLLPICRQKINVVNISVVSIIDFLFYATNAQ